MKLKRWDTDEVIFELDCDCWGDLLKGALKAQINFYRANFRKADFSNYDFSETKFSDGNFSESDFSETNFIDTNFSKSDFSESDFRRANFSKSDFRWTNFSNSNFSESDFSDANFSDTNFRGSSHNYKIGNMREWKSMQLDKYMICFNSKLLCIGCQQHSIEEWKNFTDDEISKMGYSALEWWNKWKDFIFQAIKLSIKG